MRNRYHVLAKLKDGTEDHLLSGRETEHIDALAAALYRAIVHVSEGAVRRILIVDNDRDIAEVVEAILCDSGFIVAVLVEFDTAKLRAVVDEFAPQCVLLDGQGPGVYGESWLNAAWLNGHQPTVPTIMFTADQPAADEARNAMSTRSKQAHFSGVLTKPFDIDDLIDMVSLVSAQATVD